jgi:hypothetical protein
MNGLGVTVLIMLLFVAIGAICLLAAIHALLGGDLSRFAGLLGVAGFLFVIAYTIRLKSTGRI